MDFIEISDNNLEYENIGYVNEDGTFEKCEDNTVIAVNSPPHNLVDNQSFYRNFSKKNPQTRQQPTVPKPVLKQTERTPQQPQKKVTYDDILSSLNMKVVNGKLQIIRGDTQTPQQNQQNSPMLHQRHHQHIHTQAQTYTKQNEFYNKFLQAQQQQQQQFVEEQIELTPEQIAEQQLYYKRLMMVQYLKNQQQKMHVAQVKSKKMKFV